MVWYDKHTSDDKAERSKITEQPPQGVWRANCGPVP